MKPYTATPAQIQEFVDMFRPTAEELCWDWEGFTMNGKPILSEENDFKLAHRLAFFLANPGLAHRMRIKELYLKCQNKLCVNAGHMQLVSTSEHQRLRTRDHFDKIERMRKERGFD